MHVVRPAKRPERLGIGSNNHFAQGVINFVIVFQHVEYRVYIGCGNFYSAEDAGSYRTDAFHGNADVPMEGALPCNIPACDNNLAFADCVINKQLQQKR